MSLEDIDLLFGERALGTLPDNLDNKGELELQGGAIETEHHQTESKVAAGNDARV